MRELSALPNFPPPQLSAESLEGRLKPYVVTNISLVIEVNTYVQKRSWGLGYGSTSNHPHRAAILCILVALKDSRLDLNLLSVSVEVRFPITMCVLVRSPIMALLCSLYSLHSSLPPAHSELWGENGEHGVVLEPVHHLIQSTAVERQQILPTLHGQSATRPPQCLLETVFERSSICY